ncbi:S9 family peptidase [Flavihumibacter profundi]|uniref:S9 family peptidase n=1 Tax=Flavihumibacter profundi TaxID=2716883 RepID=UPI001CC3963E|nr:DPP IV N-terminal domain-containing protein [Flavihumibacter profundi]MBZ5855683.1 DPP IV N-terminal domain-containing protein [Flavihumibacter profundi]
MRALFICMVTIMSISSAFCQRGFQWAKDGKSYTIIENSEIVSYQLPEMTRKVILDKSMVTLSNASEPMHINNYSFSPDMQKVFVFTNAKKVWRYETRGDYYVLNLETKLARKLGKSLPASSLMFAKYSPDSKKVAYVSNYNIYVEDLASGHITQVTKGGNRKLINGTFDWAYEEEFFCRDGFRWSPDSRFIAYWQIQANATKDYLMLNNTDSIYPFAKPVEYPIAGEKPSSFKIGVVGADGKATRWMNIPYNQDRGNYAPRMEWAANSAEVIVQYLDRKQQDSKLLLCSAATGAVKTIYEEKDAGWIDILPSWDQDYTYGGWDWINQGKEFIWATEKDGWRHLYRVSRDGKSETLVTKGNFDVMDISLVDEAGGFIYYLASPENATQSYLYRSKLDGSSEPERVSPDSQAGSHDYNIAPGAGYAQHSFSNYYTPPVKELIVLNTHQPIAGSASVSGALAKADKAKSPVRFFTIKTENGITMDAWMARPANFDSTKKYPVLFYVYTEPWGQTAKDEYGAGMNFLYRGNLVEDGYIYVSIDNRGTPVPKGRAWRKSVYRKIGLVNIGDQAMAAREILKLPYIDTSRVAVWGWSGGGSATLNLMFQYPEIYKTGIAIAAVGNQLTYDNIYQERYMGLPQENREDFVKGSPITYAKNLRGKLLYIHGTGDDNVHYNNAEMLVNELIRYNKQFQMMSYPNRTHSISEGEGTFDHLSTLYTQFLQKNCPPGAR